MPTFTSAPDTNSKQNYMYKWMLQWRRCVYPFMGLEARVLPMTLWGWQSEWRQSQGVPAVSGLQCSWYRCTVDGEKDSDELPYTYEVEPNHYWSRSDPYTIRKSISYVESRLCHKLFSSGVAKANTQLVMGQPTTKAVLGGSVVSSTSSTQSVTHISDRRRRSLSL